MPRSSSTGRTSLHVRRAKQGDRESLSWLVERLTPLLLAQARYRLRSIPGAACDPEDVVQDVWAVALPRIGELEAREGRETPVLLRFLATTLVHHVNNLARRRIRRRAVRREADLDAGSQRRDLADHAAVDAPGVATVVSRTDAQRLVLDAIDALDPAQREVVVLRGIEQLDNAAVAELLGVTPNAASLRYARALRKLRERLPDSVFDELA